MSFDLTGIGSVADAARAIIDKFLPDKMGDAEKAQAKLQLQELLSRRETGIIEAHKQVLVAELNQGDAFTKRARPTVVYAGLVFILLVHVVFPMMSFFMEIDAPSLTLPGEFWWTWGGICSVWSVGRSMEKRGVSGTVTGLITGINKQ